MAKAVSALHHLNHVCQCCLVLADGTCRRVMSVLWRALGSRPQTLKDKQSNCLSTHWMMLLTFPPCESAWSTVEERKECCAKVGVRVDAVNLWLIEYDVDVPVFTRCRSSVYASGVNLVLRRRSHTAAVARPSGVCHGHALRCRRCCWRCFCSGLGEQRQPARFCLSLYPPGPCPRSV